MAFCPNCGGAIPNEAKFCPNCGASLITPDREPVEPDKAVSAPTKPKRKKWPVILIIIIAVLVLILVLFLPTGVYAYRTTTFKIEVELPAKEQELWKSLFVDTYMYETTEDSYIFFNPISGLGMELEYLKQMEGFSVSVSTSGNYAYLEIEDPETGERIIITYSKPSIREYCYFVMKAGL